MHGVFEMVLIVSEQFTLQELLSDMIVKTKLLTQWFFLMGLFALQQIEHVITFKKTF